MMKIYDFDAVSPQEVFDRDRGNQKVNVAGTVTEILENVQKNGDAALYAYAEKFDKVQLSSLEVTDEELNKAFETIDPALLGTLKKAEENIRLFLL